MCGPVSPLPAITAGFALGASLIIAIGAQNAFVLRQGIARRHVWPVAALCAISDVLLITAGVLGLGSLIVSHPTLVAVARWGGAAFLVAYAALALHRAMRPHALRAAPETRHGLRGALLAAAAFTFLNPHCYLDTVVLVGGVSASYASERWWFGLGAAASSIAWFSLLAAASPRLAPLFARPRAWQVLDVVIAIVMVTIAVRLAMGG